MVYIIEDKEGGVMRRIWRRNIKRRFCARVYFGWIGVGEERGGYGGGWVGG
jgi:hypothetical protein